MGLLPNEQALHSSIVGIHRLSQTGTNYEAIKKCLEVMEFHLEPIIKHIHLI